MSVTIKTKYLGELRTESVHLKSNNSALFQNEWVN